MLSCLLQGREYGSCNAFMICMASIIYLFVVFLCRPVDDVAVVVHCLTLIRRAFPLGSVVIGGTQVQDRNPPILCSSLRAADNALRRGVKPVRIQFVSLSHISNVSAISAISGIISAAFRDFGDLSDLGYNFWTILNLYHL